MWKHPTGGAKLCQMLRAWHPLSRIAILQSQKFAAQRFIETKLMAFLIFWAQLGRRCPPAWFLLAHLCTGRRSLVPEIFALQQPTLVRVSDNLHCGSADPGSVQRSIIYWLMNHSMRLLRPVRKLCRCPKIVIDKRCLLTPGYVTHLTEKFEDYAEHWSFTNVQALKRSGCWKNNVPWTITSLH